MQVMLGMNKAVYGSFCHLGLHIANAFSLMTCLYDHFSAKDPMIGDAIYAYKGSIVSGKKQKKRSLLI